MHSLWHGWLRVHGVGWSQWLIGCDEDLFSVVFLVGNTMDQCNQGTRWSVIRVIRCGYRVSFLTSLLRTPIDFTSPGRHVITAISQYFITFTPKKTTMRNVVIDRFIRVFCGVTAIIALQYVCIIGMCSSILGMKLTQESKAKQCIGNGVRLIGYNTHTICSIPY